MNIEDNLPKAEEVLKDSGLDMSNFISYADYGAALKAMHEYAKRLLDVVADSAQIKHNDETIHLSDEQMASLREVFASWKEDWSHPAMNIYDYEIDKQSILRFKDLLK